MRVMVLMRLESERGRCGCTHSCDCIKHNRQITYVHFFSRLHALLILQGVSLCAENLLGIAFDGSRPVQQMPSGGAMRDGDLVPLKDEVRIVEVWIILVLREVRGTSPHSIAVSDIETSALAFLVVPYTDCVLSARALSRESLTRSNFWLVTKKLVRSHKRVRLPPKELTQQITHLLDVLHCQHPVPMEIHFFGHFVCLL